MKITGFIFLSILTVSCGGKSFKQSGKSNPADSTLATEIDTDQPSLPGEKGKQKQVVLGYSEQFEKLPKLVFDTISESEFNQLQTKKYLTQLKPEQRGNYFFVQTAAQKHRFKKYADYGGEASWSGNELMGYYPALKLYALTENSTSENLGFGELFLLDSLTDYQYTIVSFGDGSVQLPIPSVQNKYLVYYYNAMYDHKDADIGILKINSKGQPEKYLTEYASYHSTDFAVEKIVWKSDHCFYVKGYEEVYENEKWVKKYKYYRTVFK